MRRSSGNEREDNQNGKGIDQAIQRLESTADTRTKIDILWSFGDLGPLAPVTTIIAFLDDADGSVREAAAYALGQSMDIESVKALMCSLNDPEPYVQYAAGYALRRFMDPRPIDPAIHMLDSPYEEDASEALKILEFIGDPRAVYPLLEYMIRARSLWEVERVAESIRIFFQSLAVYPLIRALESENNKIRLYAAVVLGKLKDDRASEAIAALYDDPDPLVVDYVPSWLRDLGGPEAIGALIQLLDRADDRYYGVTIRMLGELGETAVDPLIQALASNSVRVRGGAAAALGETGSPKGIGPLVTMLKDPDAMVRRRVVKGLGILARRFKQKEAEFREIDHDPDLRRHVENDFDSLRETENRTIIIANATSDDKVLRCGSVELLGILGGSDAIDLLIEGVRDDEPSIWDAARRSLVFLGDTVVDPMLSNSERIPLDRTIRILGEIGTLKSVPFLGSLMQSNDMDVKRECVHALGMIGSSDAIPLLRAAGGGAAKELRQSIIQALIAIGSGDCIEHLIRALDDREYDIREAAANGLEKMGWQPSDEPDTVKVLFARKSWDDLVRYGDSACPLLMHGLTDPSSGIQAGCEEALVALGSTAVGHLTDYLRRITDPSLQQRVIQILGTIGAPGAIPTLREMLDTEDRDVRISTIIALGSINDPETVALITDTIMQSDPDVQEEGLLALRKKGEYERIFKIFDILAGLYPISTFPLFTEFTDSFQHSGSGSEYRDVQEEDFAKRAASLIDCADADDDDTCTRHWEAQKDPHWLVRAVCFLRIQLTGTEYQDKSLEAAVRDPHWYLRALATMVLEGRESRSSEEMLLSLTHDAELIVRVLALTSLDRSTIGTSETCDNRNHFTEGGTVEEAIAPLTVKLEVRMRKELIARCRSRDRVTYTRELGNYLDIEAHDALMALVDDSNPQVASAAAENLQKLERLMNSDAE